MIQPSSLATLRDIVDEFVESPCALSLDSATESIMPTNSFHSQLFSGIVRADSPVRLGIFDEGLKRKIPRRFGRMAHPILRAACTVLFLIVTSSLWCDAADVVFVRSVEDSSPEQQGLETAANFYGLNLKVVVANGNNNKSALSRAIGQKATVAVAIAANALPLIDENALLQALRRRQSGNVPLLVVGVTPETDSLLLRSLSGGDVVGCKRLQSPIQLQYVVGRAAGLVQQLADLDLPFPGKDTFYLALAEHSNAQTVMGVRDNHQVVPVFVATTIRHQRVFLLSSMGYGNEILEKWNAESMVNAFAGIAPEMMFVKYCAGERGWHSVGHYANLTIDDPWLREPYGHLSYKALLGEMEKHNFHTTIAFIPWNYDRSEAEVVSLFRSHPERFSVCIHGDNHDHKEFEDVRSKPLSLQIAALKQSLARMDKFQMLTGIPYDSVFVFPHSIGSERILEELKTYNVLATINYENVPIDRLKSSALLFALRPVTLSFADFPSISRYPAAIPSPSGFIGINEFLDNPLFFYSHQDFFASGMDAFDGMADGVNKLQPDTRWRSVGDIVKHLYLVRLRDDSNYDVLTFSSSLQLDNTSGRDSVFYVKKQESGSPVITSVSVDGRQSPFQLRGGYLDLSVPVPEGATRSVVIQYQNDLDLASISTSKSSFRVYLLRKVSDYRDITLSKYSVGRTLTDFYYKHDITMPLVILCGCGFIVFSIYGGRSLLVIIKRRNTVEPKPGVLAPRSDS